MLEKWSRGEESVTYHQEGTDHVGLVGVEPGLFTCVAEHVLCKLLGALDLGACLSIRDSGIVDKDVQVLLLRLDLLQDLPLRLLALQLKRKKTICYKQHEEARELTEHRPWFARPRQLG